MKLVKAIMKNLEIKYIIKTNSDIHVYLNITQYKYDKEREVCNAVYIDTMSA